jgi:hypothetical protein
MLESARQRRAEMKEHAEERDREDRILKEWHYYHYLQGLLLRLAPDCGIGKLLIPRLEGVEDLDERMRIAYEVDAECSGKWQPMNFWWFPTTASQLSQDE